PAREDVHANALPMFRRAVLIGASSARGFVPFSRLGALSDAVTDRALAERQAAVKPDDVSQIQFTSGTTGAPKGAMITHRSTINNARLVALRARLTDADRYVTAMPLFHTAGNVVDQLSMLAMGGTVIKAIAFDSLKM